MKINRDIDQKYPLCYKSYWCRKEKKGQKRKDKMKWKKYLFLYKTCTTRHCLVSKKQNVTLILTLNNENLCYWPSCLWLSVQDRTDHLTNFLLFIAPARVQVYAQKYSQAASVASLRDIQLVENWTGLARTFYWLFTCCIRCRNILALFFAMIRPEASEVSFVNF